VRLRLHPARQTLRIRNNMKKKSAFTLVETMVCLLIVSAVGMAAVAFISAYLKHTYDRDIQEAAVISNMDHIEQIKVEAKTLPQLYQFTKDREIRVIAVGVGEIDLNPDGSYTVISNENYGFSEVLKFDSPNLFRIEAGGSIPNSKITAVVMLQ